MKKKNSSNYRTLELTKIDAPNRLPKNEPKSKLIKSDSDLRAGGKK